MVADRKQLERGRAPQRSLDQRINALAKANEVRVARAALKRDLKAGRISIRVLLLDPPPYLESAKVLDMLMALPKVGRVKAAKVLQSCRVSPGKTFGGLSERNAQNSRPASLARLLRSC